MMWTIECLLAVSVLISAIVALMGKCPVTVPVLLAGILAVLGCLPVR
jgi:hypothetical protein